MKQKRHHNLTRAKRNPDSRVSRFKFQVSGSSGFTLIETIFALTVLVVGVVGAFLAISSSLRIAPASSQEVIASNLAQEGIEVLRNIRDQSMLEIGDQLKQNLVPTHTWAESFKACASTFQRRIELTNNSSITDGWNIGASCSLSNQRTFVYRQDATGFYASCSGGTGACPAGWTDSGFRRVMDFTILPAGCTGNACCAPAGGGICCGG